MRSGDEHILLNDARRERFRQTVSAAGSKARLAEHLAALRGQTEEIWKMNISRILVHTRMPAGENLLTIAA